MDPYNAEEYTLLDIKIGENIRNIRKILNLSQGEVAKKIGITAQQIHKYEHGVNRISTSTLLQMANIFNVDIGVLTGELPSSVKKENVISEARKDFKYNKKNKEDNDIAFIKMFHQLDEKSKKEIMEIAKKKIKGEKK